MKIRMFALAVSVALCGCATTYRLDGKTYNSEQEFQSAAHTLFGDAHSQLVSTMKVQTPLSNKELTVGIPTLDTVKGGIRTTGQANQTLIDNLARENHLEMEMVADTVKDLGIYRGVKVVDTTGGHLQPTATESVLYFYMNNEAKVSQWYINGVRGGQQAVNMDRGQPTFVEKMRSFFNAIKGFAISDN